ncbi:MAG: hypothetical protein KF902_08120 [Phycisphaeraceae bacterium]|nr:hypothetical protein [Phycisphaeraceae bacterium]
MEFCSTGEDGVVNGDDAGEAVEVVAGAACALGSAEFEALGLQRCAAQDRFAGQERAVGALVQV